MKHTQSEITAIKKLRNSKLHPRDIQKKNKEAFDKSYFGKEYINRNLTNK